MRAPAIAQTRVADRLGGLRAAVDGPSGVAAAGFLLRTWNTPPHCGHTSAAMPANASAGKTWVQPGFGQQPDLRRVVVPLRQGRPLVGRALAAAADRRQDPLEVMPRQAPQYRQVLLLLRQPAGDLDHQVVPDDGPGRPVLPLRDRLPPGEQ